MRVHIRRFVAATLTVLAIGLTTTAATQQAPGQNIRVVAGILARLNHFANDADKKALQGIVASTTATAHEKVLAEALINVQHTAAAADKAKLEALAKDASAPESVRTIATILAGLNHTASDAQKAVLAKLSAG
jgi:hypothetical protein